MAEDLTPYRTEILIELTTEGQPAPNDRARLIDYIAQLIEPLMRNRTLRRRLQLIALHIGTRDGLIHHRISLDVEP